MADPMILVNTMLEQTVLMVQQIAQALEDGKLTPAEGLQLGMSGMMLATFCENALARSTPQDRAALLDVLKRGRVSIEMPMTDQMETAVKDAMEMPA